MKFAAILLLSIWCSAATAQQVTDSTQLKELIMRHWVSREHGISHITFVPAGSKEAQEMSMDLQFGGTHFLKDNVRRVYYWKMCGNDDSPDYYDSNWYLRKKENHWYIIIQDERTPYYNGYRERLYKVLYAGADALELELEEDNRYPG